MLLRFHSQSGVRVGIFRLQDSGAPDIKRKGEAKNTSKKRKETEIDNERVLVTPSQNVELNYKFFWKKQFGCQKKNFNQMVRS